MEQDNLSAISFQNIMENFDIMCYLFKYFKLKDQLQLTKVCEDFKTIIVKYLWKNKHKNLAIFKINQNFVIYSNMPARDFRDILKDPQSYEVNILNKLELNLFLQMHSNNVQNLYLWGEDWKMQVFEGFLFDLNSYEFNNLNTITYCDVCMGEQNLLKLFENCPKLQYLHLKHFLLLKNNGKTTVSMNIVATPTLDCSLDYFPLKSLKKLITINLQNSNPNQIFKYSNLKEIFKCNFHIKNLFSNQAIVSDSNDSTLNNIDAEIMEIDGAESCTYKLEKLSLIFGDLQSWTAFYSTLLLKFENLQEFSLGAKYQFVMVDQEIINAISKNCLHLRKLSLQYCKLDAETFSCLKSLQKLSFYFCSGLKWINLKEVLGTDMQLSEFAFDGTQYDQWFESFEPSRSLQSLTIIESDEGNMLDLFAYALEGFENLRHLKCNKDPCDELISLKCPKLEQLQCIHSIRLWSLQGIFRHLKSFDIKVICLTWSQLLAIMQHQTLENLQLDLLSELALCDDRPPELSKNVNFDFVTNLKSLQIPMSIFKMARNFWLELLNYNRQLQLSIFGPLWNVINEQFLEDLFNSEHFPKDMKFVNFFGYEIDCQFLKTSVYPAIDRIRQYITFYSILPHTKAKFEIIFSH